MATGYGQVRSVVAQLAGDRTAAREMRLVLPETGVCNSNRIAAPAEVVGAAGCCGGPAPATVAACCVEDAVVKAQGGTGRSEEHTSELKALMRTSYAVFRLNKQTKY